MFYAATAIVLTESGLLLPVDVSAVNQRFVDDDDLRCVFGYTEYVAYRFKRRHRLMLPRSVAIRRSTALSYWDDENMANNLREWWRWQSDGLSAPGYSQPPYKLNIAIGYNRARLIKHGSSARLRADCQLFAKPLRVEDCLKHSYHDIRSQYAQYALGCFGKPTHKVSEPTPKTYRENLLEFYSYHEYGFFNLGAIYDCLEQKPTKPEL